MIGHLPFPQSVVEKALFENKNRIQWDKVLESINIIEQAEDNSILHFKARSPPGAANRDFVHARRTRQLGNDVGYVVLDVSTQHEKVPEVEGYVR